ncbi:fimbrial protein [Leclercia sp.]|uniref:fimbrial protein n=1 Tax=Leclercia sp. TaxID=1898428 RepID=UPI002FDE95A3
MRHTTALIALTLAGGLFSAFANAAITGTSSLSATFLSTVVPGTCTANVVDGAGNTTSEIHFNDVFKSDLSNKSRSEAFKVVLSQCSGVRAAEVTAMPGAGGDCSTATSDNFGATHATAFELWKGNVDSGTRLSCQSQPLQKVPIVDGGANVALNARIVIADDKTIADVTPGDVTSLITFQVEYQ